MQFKKRDDLYFGGQITGVEGYVGNLATGFVAAVNLSRQLSGDSPWVLPKTTMLGALCHYVSHAEASEFQPMKANMGILPTLDNPPRDKRLRKQAYAERSLRDLAQNIEALGDTLLAKNVTAPIEAMLPW
jgi:methylenetetrahydrofolate--tRNA-(uracil-5-)-methyltransferase